MDSRAENIKEDIIELEPSVFISKWISISGLEVAIPSTVLNWTIEPFLYLITFAVAGLYYQKGIDNPAKGSLLYLLFYCMHVGVLFVMSCFQFSGLIIAVTMITYIALHVGVNAIKKKLLYAL